MKVADPKNGKHHVDSPASPPRLTRWLAMAAVVGLLVWLWRQPILAVTKEENGRWLTSTYRLDEDSADNPRLQLLRKREKLDDVIAPGATQFEKLVLLRKWVHSQWSYSGKPFYYPAWDAVEILDLARRIGNQGFCAQYAILYLQACQSLGLHARYVELPGHFIVGVWSDDYDRWVLMDPFNDCHYERKGVPTTGRRLCDSYWKNDLKDIVKVSGDGTRTPVTSDDLKIYRMYSIVSRANQLSEPVEIYVNNDPKRVLKRESDYHAYPVVGRDKITIASPYIAWKDPLAKEFFDGKVLSEDRDDFAYPMNQNMIFVAGRDMQRGLAKLILWAENTPTFSEFEYSVDGGDWTKAPAKEVFWPLMPGTNEIRVRAMTKEGWLTRQSRCRIFYKPPWWGLVKPKPADLPTPYNKA